MTRRNLSLILFLFVFTMLSACRSTAGPASAPPAAPEPTAAHTAAPAPTPEPDPVERRLAAMSVEEKVGQLLMAGFEGTAPGEDAASLLQDDHVGGLILFGRNIESAEQLVALTNGLKALNTSAAPLLLGVDQEGGLVDRMPPELHSTPRAYDVEDPAAFGRVLGELCAAFGFSVDFAPSLDIWSNPNNTVIGTRAFGSDAERVTERGSRCASALLETGIIPVVKHFPGHGDTDVDSHAGLPTVDKTREDLLSSELLPFEAAIRGGAAASPVPAVMVAHILLTELDPDRPASLSPAVVTGLLRGELGFDGVVVTDDLTMGAVTGRYGVGEAAVLAVEAGCDLLLVCHGRENVAEARDALLAAVEDGRISQARLDESVRRLLRLKADFSVSDDPVEEPDVAALNREIDALVF